MDFISLEISPGGAVVNPLELQIVGTGFSQCSTTGVTKGHGMCYPVCGIMHIKEPFAAN